jgi:S-adenosylmethionine-diacylgycerolhomoserine-N-methlytransferase
MPSGAETPVLAGEHAVAMDRMYRYQRHIYDITRKYYLLGRDRTIRGLDLPTNGSLLEIGCGTGRNLLLAQQLFPSVQLSGLDISAEMLASVHANFRGRANQPNLRVADATDFRAGDFGTDGFDRVMISYALSMIPDWEKALDAALAAVKPGGSVHIVDFGLQQRLPRWFAVMLQSWLKRFHVTPRASLRQALEHRRDTLGGSLTFEEIGRGYAWRAVFTVPT